MDSDQKYQATQTSDRKEGAGVRQTAMGSDNPQQRTTYKTCTSDDYPKTHTSPTQLACMNFIDLAPRQDPARLKKMRDIGPIMPSTTIIIIKENHPQQP